jgi:biotin carboxyl carrier protein
VSANGGPPPEQALALVRDGRTYFAQGDVERARACFAAAVEIAPTDQIARAGLARCERLLAESTRGPDDTGGPDAGAGGALEGGGEGDTQAMAIPPTDVAGEATVVDALAGHRAELERARENARSGRGRAGRASSGSRMAEGAASRPPEPPGDAFGPDGPFAGGSPPGAPHGASPALGFPGGSAPPGGFDPAAPPGPDFGPRPGIGPGGEHGGEHAPGQQAAYPRYVAGGPGNYPQVSPGAPPMGPPGPPGHGPMLPGPGPQGMPYPPAPGSTGPFPQFGAPAASGYGPVVTWLGIPRSRNFLIGVAIAIAVGFMGLGLLVGFLAFGGGDDEGGGALATPPATASAAAGDEAAGKRAQSAPAPAPAGRPAGVMAGRIEARVKTVEHPVLATAVAPVSGEVERVHVKAGGAVTTGQRLYTLREGKGARAVETTVEAPAAGRIERRAARGDSVQKGDVLAQLVDPAVWNLVADLTSDDVNTEWSCEVSTIEGRNRASCRIEGVQRLGGQQSRVTATVGAEAATWLQGGGQELLVALSPTDSPALSSAAPAGATAGATTPSSAPAGATPGATTPSSTPAGGSRSRADTSPAPAASAPAAPKAGSTGAPSDAAAGGDDRPDGKGDAAPP